MTTGNTMPAPSHLFRRLSLVVIVFGVALGLSSRFTPVEPGAPCLTLEAGPSAQFCFCFSSDSRSLASASLHGSISVWDTETGELIASSDPDSPTDVRFIPDGKVFDPRCCSDIFATDHFWDFATRDTLKRFGRPVATVTFAPDGKAFAICGKAEIQLWQADDRPVLVKRFETSDQSVAISPDLQRIASAKVRADGAGEVTLWDTTSGRKLASMPFQHDGAHNLDLTFTGNGTVLAVSTCKERDPDADAGQTTLWQFAADPKQIGCFPAVTAVSPDGEWLAFIRDDGVKLARVSAPSEVDLVVSGDHTVFGVPTCAFSHRSNLIVVSELRRAASPGILNDWLPKNLNPFRARPERPIVRLWDVHTQRELMSFEGCDQACFSSDGTMLAMRRDNKFIDLWQLPFRKSPWHILGWAALAWVVAVTIGWLACAVRRKLLASGTR